MSDQPQRDENAEFFALLSREIDVTFPATDPIRIDRDDWELLHRIIDGVMAQGMTRATMLEMVTTLTQDEMPMDDEEREAVEAFQRDLRGVVKLHKAISSVCKRIAKGEDLNVIPVPF